MSAKHRITNLPPEIRQQIFGEYFRVHGGYVYDANSDKLKNADNTPIDLSLIYTCRSIANDCKQLPLTVNTIHFSTLYREDWRSLAGCFNLAATFYRVLQEDLVLHLAHLITPEMHTQLEKKFPAFRSKLEEAREVHFHVWNTGVDLDSAESVQPALCEFVQEFYNDHIILPGDRSPTFYQGYAQVDRRISTLPQPEYTEQRLHMSFHTYSRWDEASGEVHRCLPQCLRLIADQNPREFSSHVYSRLPHWLGKYPAEDFLHLQPDHWAIPSRSQVSKLLERLGIPNYVWELPDMWCYDYPFIKAIGDNVSQGHFSEEYKNPTSEFEFRTRERIRFSAAAAAIRFLGLLPQWQRMQLRRISLYEDLPAVNIMSLHGHGLVPLLRENPLLRIERRVSVVKCIMNLYSYTAEVTTHVLLKFSREKPWSRIGQDFAPKLSCWLLDTLSVADAGIPAESFSLLLDSGPDANACTEAFEKLVHGWFARNRAWKACLQAGLLYNVSARDVLKMARSFATENGFHEAVMQLVNHSSTLLRCNFNPGLPMSHQKMLDEMVEEPEGAWEYWVCHTILGSVSLPDHLDNLENLAKVCDFEPGGGFLHSRIRGNRLVYTT